MKVVEYIFFKEIQKYLDLTKQRLREFILTGFLPVYVKTNRAEFDKYFFLNRIESSSEYCIACLPISYNNKRLSFNEFEMFDKRGSSIGKTADCSFECDETDECVRFIKKDVLRLYHLLTDSVEVVNDSTYTGKEVPACTILDPGSDYSFDVKEYVINRRTAIDCKRINCIGCKKSACRNSLAHEIFTKYGDHSPYRITLCNIGIAMGCPIPTWAKDDTNPGQLVTQKAETNAVKSQVRRWIAKHAK